MNSFVLKLIACITMFIDHIGYVVFNGKSSFFNYIGRLSFPIFAFQISEGYLHTRNIKKYIIRLLTFAVISQIPFMLFHSILSDEFAINVIFTLLFGLLSIIVYDKCHKLLGILAVIVLGIIAQYAKFDYGFYGVFITFLFYVFSKNKLLLASGFIISTIINYSYKIFQYNKFGIEVVKVAFSYYLPFLICTLFSIIFILMYNKKKGPNTKYLLYLFYPLHLLLIYVLNILIWNISIFSYAIFYCFLLQNSLVYGKLFC